MVVTMGKNAMRSTTSESNRTGLTTRGREAHFRRFLVYVFTAVLTTISSVLAINVAVDPLWYWSGNTLTDENFAFNERFAKLNQFLSAPNHYDCLIFGSSRVTLLDQTRIKDYTCANLSFSAGMAPEYVTTARYIRALGYSPKLVIVGTDAFNFWRNPNARLPKFIKRGEPPPGWIRTYLAANALYFSLRTLSGSSPMDRAYDSNLVGKVDERAPAYTPPARDKMRGRAWRFEVSRQEKYFELREIFPEARFVGYVPPVSAWRTVEELYLTDYLDLYLQTIVRIAERFDAMYDFSVPSEITMRPENTYDGGHFLTPVNRIIADVIQGQSKHFGINVRDITLAEYSKIYKEAIAKFLRSIETDGSS